VVVVEVTSKMVLATHRMQKVSCMEPLEVIGVILESTKKIALAALVEEVIHTMEAVVVVVMTEAIAASEVQIMTVTAVPVLEMSFKLR